MKKSIFIIGILTFLFQGCASSYLKESTNVSEQKKSYDKILVISRSKDKTSRIRSENSIAGALSAKGIKAEAAIKVINTNSLSKEITDSDLDNLVKKLVSEGYDGVIVTNLINTQQYTDVIPGNSSTTYYPVRYGRFGRFYRAYPVTTWEPDRVQTGVEYVLESVLYDLRDNEGDNLQWIGRFEVRDPSNLTNVTEKYTQELVDALLENSINP